MLYSHPEDFEVLVYYVKDCDDEAAATELFINNGKKRLGNDYVLYRADTTVQDALDFNYRFYST